ncbi:EpsG family protein [Sphingobacterium mizutaii]|uniref:EpsG family protein n=1 Tax=Sphingobacterium mizutaii TaxID=1010 RepID=UPI0016293E93|nr:EpsG family protein [Sphingobacterium mizutaii]
MTIYFLLFIFLFFCQIFIKRNTLVFGASSIVAIFLCFTYMNGSDWRQYELIYNGDYQTGIFSFEPGFMILLKVFNSIGVEFWHFFILVKIICFYLFVKKLYSFLPNNYFTGLALFISFFGLFLFIDCPLRNLISVTIALYSVPYLLERNFKKFLIVALIASLFHISAIALILLYFVGNFSASKIRLITIYIGFYLGLILLSSVLKSGIGSLFSGIPFIGDKIVLYFAEENEASSGNVFTLGLLLRSILFIVLIINKDEIIKRYGLVFFNQIVVFFFLYRFSVTFPIFMRFTLFYSLFFVIGTTMLFNIYSWRYRPIVFGVIYLYLLSNMYTLITTSYKYIPYSNYLEYLNKEKPSYSERSMFNYEQSPYYDPND